MFDDPHAYFFENVVASYTAYTDVRGDATSGQSRDTRAALAAASALFHFREHLPPQHPRTREELARICPDFDLLGDIVNASKHNVLTRGKPAVTSAKDVYEVAVSTRYRDEQGEYHHAEKNVLVRLKDGTTRDVADVLRNVLDMWANLLFGIGVLPHPLDVKRPPSGPPAPVPRSEAKPLNLEMVQGIRFHQQFAFQEYNYETQTIDPVDLSDAEKITFRAYKPRYSVEVHLNDATTGQTHTREIDLTDEENDRYLELKFEDKKQAFMWDVATKRGVIRQLLRERSLPPGCGTWIC